uniref:RxLR effector candidate protein n=1 Tax=Hyaloperonospora arabidopsidis (strain Emoy2) TaxID=559515 RepID=M4BTW5_HYAAE
METSQICIGQDEPMCGAIESGLFASALGANMGDRAVHIDAQSSQNTSWRPARREHMPGPEYECSPSESLGLRSPTLLPQPH